jgi:hypothetical protein
VVLEVDKSRILEPLKDGISRLLLRRGVARKEDGEVNELGDVRMERRIVGMVRARVFPGRPATLPSLL